MSDFPETGFLEHVLKQPPVPRRATRTSTAGLSGSGRRYAVLLTLMAGMTAVPSWIILKAGVSGLDSNSTTAVQPLLLPASPPWQGTSPAPGLVELLPQPVVPRVPIEGPVPDAPPPPEAVPPVPALERRSVVDLPDRPVRQKPKKNRTPARPANGPVPSGASASPTPAPSTVPAPSTTPAPSINPAPPGVAPSATPGVSSHPGWVDSLPPWGPTGNQWNGSSGPLPWHADSGGVAGVQPVAPAEPVAPQRPRVWR